MDPPCGRATLSRARARAMAALGPRGQTVGTPQFVAFSMGAFQEGVAAGIAVVTTADVLSADSTGATDDTGTGPSIGGVIILLLGLGA